MERRHITNVLQASAWRIEGNGGAACVLGMKPSTLRSRMVKLGIVRADRKRAAAPVSERLNSHESGE